MTSSLFAKLRCFSSPKLVRTLAIDWKSAYTPERAREYLSEFKGGSVTVEKDDKSGIAKVLISHEEKKNAFSGKMMVDLEGVVDELEQWQQGRLAIVGGANGIFCSGADIDFLSKLAASPEDGYMMNTYMGGVLRRLRRLHFVTIANGQGFVLGGATEVFLSCDIRAVQKGTKIGFVHARMGLGPAWSGGSRMVEVLGRSKAIKSLVTSKIYSSEEAIDSGIAIFRYDTPAEFDKFIEKFTKNSVAAIRACKEMITMGDRVFTIEEKHQAERKVFLKVFGGPDNLKAFSKKVKHA